MSGIASEAILPYRPRRRLHGLRPRLVRLLELCQTSITPPGVSWGAEEIAQQLPHQYPKLCGGWCLAENPGPPGFTHGEEALGCCGRDRERRAAFIRPKRTTIEMDCRRTYMAETFRFDQSLIGPGPRASMHGAPQSGLRLVQRLVDVRLDRLHGYGRSAADARPERAVRYTASPINGQILEVPLMIPNAALRRA